MKKWIFPITMLIAFEAIADITAKEYSLGKSIWVGVLAIALYVIGNIFWLVALKQGAELSEGAVIFSVTTAIFAVIIGLVYFKESAHPTQIAGMILGILAVILMIR